MLTSLIGSAYGAIDEIHQYFVPGRNSDILDWVANTIGSILGALAIMLVIKKFWKIKEAMQTKSADQGDSV